MQNNQKEMKNIAIYSLTSELHDERAVASATEEFLGSLSIDYEWRGGDFSDYGSHTLELIYVRTGGTEGLFLRHAPQVLGHPSRPVFLLTSGKSNSLAASMEILSFLRQNGYRGEIIHGPADYVASRIKMLERVGEARWKLEGCRLGIIGRPSDWLIASDYDSTAIEQSLGMELVTIPMDELLDVVKSLPLGEEPTEGPSEAIRRSVPGAERICEALREIIGRYRLDGFTLRCFDLLTSVRNTGCLALARLNAEGIVAGCEGDVPAMLTMKIAQAMTGCTGFQANPSSIDVEKGQMLFAHCTIPFNMVERYELDTHFESGIGVGIRGFMKEGPVTVLKFSGNLSRCFIAEGQLIGNQAKPDLCRTQQLIQLDDVTQTRYFLTDPIGNHHIILPGRHRELFEQLWMQLSR